MTKARITVIVSLFNYQHVVTDALESIKAQSLPHLALVVVDDASTDNSATVARRWMDRNHTSFSRCVLLTHHRNRGLSAARNTALAHCQSEYIFVLDADDRIYPRCLEKLLKALENSPAFMAYPIIAGFGKSLGLLNTDLWDINSLRSSTNRYAVTSLLRSAVFKAIGNFDPHPEIAGWEDYDLWIRMARSGMRAIHVPQILAEYDRHEGSFTSAFVKDDIPGHILYLHQKHHDFFFPQTGFSGTETSELVHFVDCVEETPDAVRITGWVLHMHDEILIGHETNGAIGWSLVSHCPRADVQDQHGDQYANCGFRAAIPKMGREGFRIFLALRHGMIFQQVRDHRCQLPEFHISKTGHAHILMYHRVTSSGDDPDAIELSFSEFEAHLSALTRDWRIVSLSELVENLKHHRSNRGAVSLTFDDGYRDNFAHAWPLLTSLSLPATFFVPVNPCLLGQPLWIESLKEACRSPVTLQLPGKAGVLHLPPSVDRYRKLFGLLKKMRPIDQTLAINTLARQSDSSFEDRTFINRVELAAINASKLFEIASHGLTHACLTHLDDRELHDQIVGSKHVLESFLHEKINHFCILFGNIGDFDFRAINLVKEHYQSCLTTFPGSVRSDSSPFCLPRIDASRLSATQLLKSLANRFAQ